MDRPQPGRGSREVRPLMSILAALLVLGDFLLRAFFCALVIGGIYVLAVALTDLKD